MNVSRDTNRKVMLQTNDHNGELDALFNLVPSAASGRHGESGGWK